MSTEFPAALAEVALVEFPYDSDDDIDFEPYQEFRPDEDTAYWLPLWTGTDLLNPRDFLVFGQDGSGGYAVIWLAREDVPVIEQPVVFMGSEGEHGVIASDLADFLWLLADGSGPYEAVEDPERPSRPHPELTAIAERHAPAARKSAAEVISLARQRFPQFEGMIDEACG
ncbi:SMI1/KNR4 family protein [Kutzneria chonburiensis]|uniref:SMI1/KNR4 family protein n=1 Tax=Kutzneria chonburiensis TaxID=1483604 RepID=A0ABV6MLW4_9PSEU|nr:SMI1/KNR4 family protein [Kutzneria chonburiensis]